jgi:V/A-type H+-transporting ATPase subunit E
MELQIQDLVSSIRKEGIDAANAEAESILAEAKKKADAIISDAKAQAENAKATAEKEIGIMKESASVSAQQAKRDAVLAFKTEIQKEYENILKKDIKKELSGEALGKLIRAAITGEDISTYTAEVAEVTEALQGELAEEIKNGLEIKPTKGVNAGFRLASKDGSGYFDCTDEAVAEMVMPYFRDLDI